MLQRHRGIEKTLRITLFASALLLPAKPVLSAMTLPGGDFFGTGEFQEIGYGQTGLAYVTPLLYVGNLAETSSPSGVGAVTNLDYSYQVAGLGSPLLTLTYRIVNHDPGTFNDLRFMVDVQADGSSSYSDTTFLGWNAKNPGDPDKYQIASASPAPVLLGNIVAANGLNNSDVCAGGPCDADFALQWNLASIAPGKTWQITVGLADDGSTLSNRYLRATSVDTLNTSITFSGNAAVVPVPSALILLGSALGALGAARRRS